MNTLADIELIDIIAPSLRGDANVQASLSSLQTVYRQLVSDLQSVQFRSAISRCSDNVLNHLAIEFRVAYYNPSDSRDKREQSVLNAVRWLIGLGTPGVIDEVCSLYFNYAQVQENWQYGGVPFHFRVLLGADTTNSDVVGAATAMILAYKNVRSWFDGFVRAYAVAPSQGYIACGLWRQRTQTIRFQ